MITIVILPYNNTHTHIYIAHLSEYFPLKHFHVYMVLLYSSVVVVVEVVDVIVFVLLFGLRGCCICFV